VPDRSIGMLPQLIEQLPGAARQVVERLFLVTTSTGVCRVPASMRSWAREQFGSVEAIERQRIVRVTNRYTLEGAVFNPLRALRPTQQVGLDLEDEIAASVGDPFCTPLTMTSEDAFGRLRGRYCVSASNVAKSEGAHGLIVFDEHDPLDLTGDRVADYLSTALQWARRAHALDREAVYPLVMWNCLWRAGASVIHGHAQVLLTRGMHFPRVERWRRAGREYRQLHGRELHEDLIAAHDALGLAWWQNDVAGMAYLAPTKEKEVLLVAQECEAPFAQALATVLRCFTDDLGVRSFNVAVWLPPLGPCPEDWSAFPVLARVVDRGSVESRASDIGAIELYAASAVASDPFDVARMASARVHSTDCPAM